MSFLRCFLKLFIIIYFSLLPHVIPGGVVILQYAYDTILFLDASIEHAINFKWMLSCVEKLSQMKINFHKSDLHTLRVEDDLVNSFAQILVVKLVLFCFKYLGVPLQFKKMRRGDLQPVIDRIIKIISGWLGRNLSYRGKLTLLTTVLPVFQLTSCP